LKVEPQYILKDDDYLKLWIYFEDRADKIKEAMFKTLTWTIGLAAAMLGFIFVKLTEFEAAKAAVELRWVVIVTSLAGLVICLYCWFMLRESGKHIQSNWDRSKECEAHIRDFRKITHPGGKTRTVILNIWNQLLIIVGLFAAAFAFVLAWIIDAG
jgi:Co/Zn/Cd efflux system component